MSPTIAASSFSLPAGPEAEPAGVILDEDASLFGGITGLLGGIGGGTPLPKGGIAGDFFCSACCWGSDTLGLGLMVAKLTGAAVDAGTEFGCIAGVLGIFLGAAFRGKKETSS